MASDRSTISMEGALERPAELGTPASSCSAAPLHQVFCGNFEYDAEERDIVRLFEKYGPVEKIDMKTGER